jgi:lysozyme
MSTLYGVDTSFANGTPDWPQALTSNRVAFVIARACYGQNSADDDGAAFVNAHDACKAASVPFGAYMFWIAGQDGAAQATHFLEAANGRYGQIAPVVDVEEGSGAHGWPATAEERIANLARTLSTIEAECGQPIIYTNADTWTTYFAGTDAFSGHRFWIAQYGVDPGKFDLIPGVKEVVLHQFSDGAGMARIEGLSTPGNNVDRDVLVAASGFLALAKRP